MIWLKQGVLNSSTKVKISVHTFSYQCTHFHICVHIFISVLSNIKLPLHEIWLICFRFMSVLWQAVHLDKQGELKLLGHICNPLVIFLRASTPATAHPPLVAAEEVVKLRLPVNNVVCLPLVKLPLPLFFYVADIYCGKR